MNQNRVMIILTHAMIFLELQQPIFFCCQFSTEKKL